MTKRVRVGKYLLSTKNCEHLLTVSSFLGLLQRRQGLNSLPRAGLDANVDHRFMRRLWMNMK